jgi:uncharacterized protein (TIGR03435 family)
MFRSIVISGLAVLAGCGAALAQGGDGQTFVVATIKPAAPMEPGRMMIGTRGGPGTQSPGQITATNLSVREMMATAYNVKDYQIVGPEWLTAQRFDIVAKVPEGATKEDVQVMWQNLLKDRFGLKLHHDSKEMPILALVVGKNGPKFKESEPAAAAGSGPAADGPDGAPGLRIMPKMGKDGMPEAPAGMRRAGGVMMMMVNGKMRLIGTGVPVGRLVDLLARQYNKPVTDQTGLTKNYDFTLDFAPEGMMRGMPMPGGGGGMMAGPGAGGDGGGANIPDGNEAANLATAIQEQLGLKLEPKKGPVDLLVIDHVEKTPTEN